MRSYYAIDDTLYERTDRAVGQLAPHTPSKEILRHAGTLAVAEGEFAQLTGTLFVFHSPESGPTFFELQAGTR